ncbi:MAG: hypothetical protein ACXWLH_00510 [Candidatus Saccharimonadales bacterium]
MSLRIKSDEVYRQYRDELDAAAEAFGFKPSHGDTLLNAATDMPDGNYNLDSDGFSQARVQDGRIVSVIETQGGTALTVMGWAVEEAKRRRAENWATNEGNNG